MHLFDQLYWNTIHPEMNLRTVDGGKVKPLTNLDEYRDANRKLAYLHTFIKDGIGLKD